MEGWERVKKIMDREGLNKNSFSLAVGLTNNVTITRIIKEHRNPSPNTCKKIIERFPQYNYVWLLKGEGEMLKDKNVSYSSFTKGNQNISSVGDIQGVFNTSISESESNIIEENKLLKEENKLLKEENKKLKDDLLKSKDEIINLLINKHKS